VIAAPLPEVSTRDHRGRRRSTDSSVERSRPSVRNTRCDSFAPSDRNQGKAAALRRRLPRRAEEFSIIQDADLEYNPAAEYGRAPEAIARRAGRCGIRLPVRDQRRAARALFLALTRESSADRMCNIFADLNLTDMKRATKPFARLLLPEYHALAASGFGFEPEITIKLAKRQPGSMRFHQLQRPHL